MKWFAVEMMAISIEEGYRNPMIMHNSRNLEGRWMRGARAGWDWLKKGNGKDFPRRWLGDNGMLMIVKPINWGVTEVKWWHSSWFMD
jgi:hypothetical protein